VTGDVARRPVATLAVSLVGSLAVLARTTLRPRHRLACLWRTTLEVGDVVVEHADELPPLLTELVEHVNLVGLARQVVEIDLAVFPHRHPSPVSHEYGLYCARI
jgi:hypothetical protein